MGWLLLIVGMVLWWVAHLFKRALPRERAKLGAAGKGAVALVVVAGVALMAFGFWLAPHIVVLQPPAELVHVNNLLILVAIYLMSPAPKRGRLLNSMRHPMLTGFALWALAHLLVNGDLASILLFSGLLGWAGIQVFLINRAEPQWEPRPHGSYTMDAAMLAASALLFVLIGLVHSWLGVWPFP